MIPSNFVIPPACLPTKGTTYAECSAINNLWNSKFTYCCPLFNNGYDYYGAWGQIGGSVKFTPPMVAPYPQIQNEKDPAGFSSFFFRGTKHDLLSIYGYPNLVAAKWVGKGNEGGCKMFWECSSQKDKASCKALGGVCSWQGAAGCVESPLFAGNIKSYYYE